MVVVPAEPGTALWKWLAAGFVLGSLAWLIGGWTALAQGASFEPRGTPAQLVETIGFRVAAGCLGAATLVALRPRQTR